MTQARFIQIDPAISDYYNCTCRCVRKSFLCGYDKSTKKDYSHRKLWVVERLTELTQAFAIDVCSYAIMSNHAHYVLHINHKQAKNWTDEEVVIRWHSLFNGTLQSRQFLAGDTLDEPSQRLLNESIEHWREKLSSISFFMQLLNQHIARQANIEDECTGHFWEGRFKSQALLDEAALMACMAYVDLNPIRAKMADTPEESDYTSIQQRIHTLLHDQNNDSPTQPIELYPFAGNVKESMPDGIPFRLEDYIALVDWSGKQLHEGKRGQIDSRLPDIISRLGIKPENWQYLTTEFEKSFTLMVGHPDNVEAACAHLGKAWTKGINQCRQLFQQE